MHELFIYSTCLPQHSKDRFANVHFVLIWLGFKTLLRSCYMSIQSCSYFSVSISKHVFKQFWNFDECKKSHGQSLTKASPTAICIICGTIILVSLHQDFLCIHPNTKQQKHAQINYDDCTCVSSE